MIDINEIFSDTPESRLDFVDFVDQEELESELELESEKAQESYSFW